MKEKTAKDVILVNEPANDFLTSDDTTGNERTNTPSSHDFKVAESSDAGNKPMYDPMIGAVKHYERKIEKSGNETESNVSKKLKLLTRAASIIMNLNILRILIFKISYPFSVWKYIECATKT